MATQNFSERHIGPRESDVKSMLSAIGASSIDELINQTIPSKIRLKNELNLAKPLTEYEYLNHIKTLSSKNKLFKSYIGLGYYNTILPSVIKC